MPTQRLIDINTAAITYRTKCLMALDKKMYRNCIGSIISLNSLLPEDDNDQKYRIIFDADTYYQKIKESYIIVCTECEKEFQYHTIQILEVDLSEQEKIITGLQKQKIWICPKCKKENILGNSRLIKTALQKPYYHRVVPDPPTAKWGLLSQLDFHKEMVDWVWLCLNSLEEGFTRFRDDNWNKKSEEYDNLEIDTSIEEGENTE